MREDKLDDWDHNTWYTFMKLSKIKNSIFFSFPVYYDAIPLALV